MKTLLFIPTKDDPNGLLLDGTCGSRPPLAHRWNLQPTMDLTTPWESGPGQSGERALVLFWKGKETPEGCDRLVRALNEDRVRGGRHNVWLLMSTYGYDEALSYARTYIDRFGGSTHAH
jgi:hypothetical protein